MSKWTAHIVAALGHRDQALALGLFPGELPRSSNGFGFFAILALGGLLIGLTALHLSNNALALHLPFEGLESLIDIVVANEDLQLCSNRVAAAVACGQLLTNSSCRFAKTNRNLEPGRVNLHRYIWRSSTRGTTTRRLSRPDVAMAQFLAGVPAPIARTERVHKRKRRCHGDFAHCFPSIRFSNATTESRAFLARETKYSRRILVGNRRASLPPVTF